ncbi:hypothetical protein DMUE_4359 [Dictyocoela muelleri]|nr:hypothetical protein DMUE_4359 [Dictyocoela muelleri]
MTKRINRWMLTLEEYDYKLKHISGEENNDADILSRSFHIKSESSKGITGILKHANALIDKLNQIKDDNENDIYKKKIIENLQELHNLLTLPGKNKMFETIKNYVHIKNLKKAINNICKNCIKCQEEKSYAKPAVLTKFVTEPYRRFEIIAIDIKGPIKTIHFETRKIKKETYIELLQIYSQDTRKFPLCTTFTQKQFVV